MGARTMIRAIQAMAMACAVSLSCVTVVTAQVPVPPARKNAEDCLREKVAEAVAASSGAADAANFLIT
jgi:lipopolysaccharide export LptBFGC system permease protein LptF